MVVQGKEEILMVPMIPIQTTSAQQSSYMKVFDDVRVA